MIMEIREQDDISGDGRHDSMGYSAKFCAYSIFSNTTSKVVHFEIVQVIFSNV